MPVAGARKQRNQFWHKYKDNEEAAAAPTIIASGGQALKAAVTYIQHFDMDNITLLFMFYIVLLGYTCGFRNLSSSKLQQQHR